MLKVNFEEESLYESMDSGSEQEELGAPEVPRQEIPVEAQVVNADYTVERQDPHAKYKRQLLDVNTLVSKKQEEIQSKHQVGPLKPDKYDDYERDPKYLASSEEEEDSSEEAQFKSADFPALGIPMECEVNLHAPALLPSDYCADVQARLGLYKRLAHAADADALTLLQEELIDRFGELPLQGQSLLATHRLRLLVKPLCIQKLDATNDQITLQFSPDFARLAPIEPIKIINLIQKNRSYKLAGQDKISLLRHCPTLNDKVAAVKDMISQLSQ